jgi:hypothetical protein
MHMAAGQVASSTSEFGVLGTTTAVVAILRHTGALATSAPGVFLFYA